MTPGARLVAICSEGPFFRQDQAAVGFREWLDRIDAYTEKLPAETFRESGTGVATRLIVATATATAPGTRPEHARDREPEPEATVRNIPLREIDPDPDQPRKTFGPSELSELAASIRAIGLLQPITVREGGPNGYLIVAGERRYRAHLVNRVATIRAIVVETADLADVRIKQIIENDQRADVPPLEQARSYQALMDEQGWTPAELGSRIGKAAHWITERTDLLKIAPDYQQLLASGNLKPSEGTELALLSPRGQATLFNAIRAGSCKSYGDLRASASALVNAEAQLSLMPPDAPPPPSDEDRRLATTFEANVERIALLLRTGIHDNHVVAVRKVSPHRAGNLADLFGQMQKDLRRIEVALREAAIQESFLAA
jgi:ParB family chromosome partitioning protein